MTVVAVADKNIEQFIARWQGLEGGRERSNYQLFLIELADALGLERPAPADARRQDDVFERPVTFREPDGSASTGFIDLYRKGSFVLEAKQSRQRDGKKSIPGQADLFKADEPTASLGRRTADRAWDVLMLNARRQAQDYAKALEPSEGWPPFLIVCDVGHCLEVLPDRDGILHIGDLSSGQSGSRPVSPTLTRMRSMIASQRTVGHWNLDNALGEWDGASRWRKQPQLLLFHRSPE
jgi:hypothetical protein